MIYNNPKLIRAHQDISIPYHNHHYDREVRDAICSSCHKIIGEQVLYIDIYKEFKFETEKDNYRYCPYCGHKFKR